MLNFIIIQIISFYHDLMVASLTDARLATVTRIEGYVSWGVYNILLTPAFDWIHDCIWDWTREWDPALNMRSVWPTRRQRVIAMLRVVQWANFPSRAEPRRKDESGNSRVAPKGANPMFPAFPVFFVSRLDPLLVFDGLTIFRQRATKNTGYAHHSPTTA